MPTGFRKKGKTSEIFRKIMGPPKNISDARMYRKKHVVKPYEEEVQPRGEVSAIVSPYGYNRPNKPYSIRRA